MLECKEWTKISRDYVTMHKLVPVNVNEFEISVLGRLTRDCDERLAKLLCKRMRLERRHGEGTKTRGE